MSERGKLNRLRSDVRILRTGPREFRLLDPSTGANFELGARERYMLVLLHECDTPAELCAAFESRFGLKLEERECLEFCEQLRRQGLLEGSAPQPAVSDEIPHRSSLPLQLRGEPANVFFDLLTLLFGWLIHPVWLWLVVPLLAFEVLLIAGEWQRFREVRGLRNDGTDRRALRGAVLGASRGGGKGRHAWCVRRPAQKKTDQLRQAGRVRVDRHPFRFSRISAGT
jgi:hypothetical protein